MPRPPAHLFEKKLLADFSGGLNDTGVEPAIKDNEAQTATNVFCALRGGVEKRYGYVSDAGPAAEVDSMFARLLNFSPQSITPGDTILEQANNDVYLPNITSFQSGGANYFPTYANGTATFTNGSKTVTLSTGTAEWLAQIMPNDQISHNFVQGSPSTWFTVNTQTDNSTIQLVSNFTGSTATYTYAVRQRVLSYPVKGCMYNGSLFYGPGIGTNGGTTTSPGTIIYYNGTNTKRVPTSPASIIPGLFCAYKNYLFACDIGYIRNSRVYWSALLDGTTWPSVNFVDVSPNDGQSVRCLYVHNDVLYIFKDHDIYYLVGNVFDPANPSYSLNKVINPYGIGTYHGDSVKVFNNQLTFLGPDGVYELDSFSGLTNISEPKIRTTIRSLNNPKLPVSLNGTNAEATAIVYDNRYWLSVQTNAITIGTKNTNNLTLCLEPNGAWTRHSFAVQNFILSQASTKFAMIGIEATTWNALSFDGTATNDGGSATTATWSSKVFSLGDFSKTTHILELYVMYYNGSANQAVSLKVFDDAGQIGSTAAWTFPGATTQFFTVQKFAIDRDTNSLYWTVTDNTASKGFRMLGAILVYEKDAMGSGVIVTS